MRRRPLAEPIHPLPPPIFVNKKSPNGDFLFKKIECRTVASAFIEKHSSYNHRYSSKLSTGAGGQKIHRTFKVRFFFWISNSFSSSTIMSLKTTKFYLLSNIIFAYLVSIASHFYIACHILLFLLLYFFCAVLFHIYSLFSVPSLYL